MAAEKQNKNGRLRLKQDLAKGSFQKLYVLYGEEDYLREYCLRQLKAKRSPTSTSSNWTAKP